jgi:hypothetical protein
MNISVWLVWDLGHWLLHNFRARSIVVHHLLLEEWLGKQTVVIERSYRTPPSTQSVLEPDTGTLRHDEFFR